MILRRFAAAAVLTAVMFCSACTTPQPVRACASVEIAELAAAGVTNPRHLHTTDGDSVEVSATSLVTTSDVAAARPAMAEGDQVLEVDLNDAAAARLRDFTAAHVGTRLAFIVNGSVRNMARILDPLRGQGLIIDPVTPAEATSIADCLHR